MSAHDANPDATGPPDVDTALTALHEQGDQGGFLQALASGEVVLPQPEPAPDDESVRLPFVEQEGTRYVVAFSNRERLDESGFAMTEAVVVGGAQLGAVWPTDDELWLAINPGSEQGIALPPESVRSLTGTAAS